MEYYKYYLCIGLGSWLMAKIVDVSNPRADRGFVEEIVSFLLSILLWPIGLLGNYIHSRQLRQMEEEIAKETKALLQALGDPLEKSNEEFKKLLDAHNASRSDEDKQDGGEV